VVVVVGLTEAGVPLVTEILPGVMTPVPPVKTAVRLELCPEPIEGGLATKLVMAGAATAWTVVVEVTLGPPEPLTVRV
jgi:hypothetical protein